MRGTLLTGVAVALILLPWRIFTSVQHLENPEYSLGDALDPAYLYDRLDRLGAALRSVAGHAFSLDWGLLVPLGLAAIVAALLSTGTRRLGVFAALWTLLSFAGVILVFWISVVPVDLTLRWAAYRTVASLVIGLAALAPLLAGEAWKTSRSRGESGGASASTSVSPGKSAAISSAS